MGLFPDLILFSLVAVSNTVDHSFLYKAFSCLGFHDFTFFWFFSSFISGWLFSASFGGCFLCPYLKHWCSSGVWLRFSFLHALHRWWIVLSFPVASITIYLQIILKSISPSLSLSQTFLSVRSCVQQPSRTFFWICHGHFKPNISKTEYSFVC